MFISRDPNISLAEIKKFGGPVKVVQQWLKPRKKGLGNFFNDFLINNNLWAEFLSFLSNPSSIPRFYWTHAVKCHSYNNDELVSSADKLCKLYLKAEIDQIKPILIIAAGIHVALTLSKLNLGATYSLPTQFRTLKNLGPHNMNVCQQLKGIAVIPHPSRIPYQKWKNGSLSIGYSQQDLLTCINKII